MSSLGRPSSIVNQLVNRVESIEHANTIIPHYEQASTYYVLLNRKLEVDYDGEKFGNIE